jgi:hypothetical protein
MLANPKSYGCMYAEATDAVNAIDVAGQDQLSHRSAPHLYPAGVPDLQHTVKRRPQRAADSAKGQGWGGERSG